MLLRTIMVASPVAGVGDFSGDFFVLSQMRRHSCDFIVSVNSLGEAVDLRAQTGDLKVFPIAPCQESGLAIGMEGWSWAMPRLIQGSAELAFQGHRNDAKRGQI